MSKEDKKKKTPLQMFPNKKKKKQITQPKKQIPKKQTTKQIPKKQTTKQIPKKQIIKQVGEQLFQKQKQVRQQLEKMSLNELRDFVKKNKIEVKAKDKQTLIGRLIPRINIKKGKQLKIKEKHFGHRWDLFRWIDNFYKDNKGFICIKLLPNIYLYRGNKNKTILNRETYFAPWYGTTNGYIPKKKTGFLEIYQIKNNNLKLLDLSNVENINKLLRDTFHNKEEYQMIKEITIGAVIMATMEAMIYAPSLSIYAKFFSQFESETQPYQLTIPLRRSVMVNDFKFSQWLCKNNYDGYASVDMISISPEGKIGKTPDFPAEIMLCSPQNDVQLIRRITTKAFETLTDMEESIGQQYLNLNLQTNR